MSAGEPLVVKREQELNTCEQNLQISPGISKPIFRAVQSKMKEKKMRNHPCILLFTDSPIKRHVDYWSQEDCLVGFEDLGFIKTKHLADRVTMFMLVSIKMSWKQPVGFAFTDSEMKSLYIVRYFKEIVKEAKNAGLRIVASICHYRQVEAIDLLLAETRKAASLKGEIFEENTIVIDGEKIVPLFNPPSLLMALRNALLENDIFFEGRAVKWAYIQQAYKLAVKISYYPILWTLSSDHIDPAKISKDNLLSCIDTFSVSLGNFISMCTDSMSGGLSDGLPQEAAATGSFICFIADLFKYVSQGIVDSKSSHLSSWVTGKLKLASIEIPGDRNQLVPLWIRTLAGLISIKQNLCQLDCPFFSIETFSCDPLENSLDVLRQSSVNILIPTCKSFISFYHESLFIKNMSLYYPVVISRSWDGLKHFVKNKDIPKYIERDHHSVDWKPPMVSEENINFSDQMVVNFVIQYLRKHIFNNKITCLICVSNLCRPNQVNFKQLRNDQDILNAVKESIIRAMIRMFFHVKAVMCSLICHYRISEKIQNYLETVITLNLEKCPHVENLKAKLVNGFIKQLIKENVRMFQKSAVMDTADIILNV